MHRKFKPSTLLARSKHAQAGALPRIAAQWNIPMEIAMDLAKLALFDTVMLVDDSGSMGELVLRRRFLLGEVAER